MIHPCLQTLILKFSGALGHAFRISTTNVKRCPSNRIVRKFMGVYKIVDFSKRQTYSFHQIKEHRQSPTSYGFQHIEAETRWTPFHRRHFEMHFLDWKILIPIKISLKFVPKGPINYIPALVQIMDWRRPGDKPLSEPMMVRLPTHICVTRPQSVNRTC